MSRSAKALGLATCGSLVVAAGFGGCVSSSGNSPGNDAGQFTYDSGAPFHEDASANDATVAKDVFAPQDGAPNDSAPGQDAPSQGGDTGSPNDAGSEDAGGDGGSCPHSACTPGAALAPSCAPIDVCTTGVDPYCCSAIWDLTCIVEMGTQCSTPLTDAGYQALGGTEQTVIAAAISDRTVCAVTSTHDLYCWGDDAQAEIGDGRMANNAVAYFPRKVASGVAAVAAEPSGTCTIGTDQGLRCWGNRIGAFLSDGGAALAPPTAAMLPGVTDITSGYDPGDGVMISCAVAGTQTYCWGFMNGSYDQLAPGIPWPSTAPAVVVPPDAGPAGGTIVKIFSGGANACALDANGSAACWGSNAYGQLGDLGSGGNIDLACIPNGHPDSGTINDCNIPQTGIVKMAMAGTSNCMLFADHSVKCIGPNGTGELAQGNTTGSNVAYPVAPTTLPPLADIAAGWDFYCGAPVDTSQPVVCWGSTFENELGPNTPTTGSGTGTPVTVPGLTNVTSLVGCWQGMCAVKADGSIWCWGDNSYNQLGVDDPAGQGHATPVRAPILSWP